MRDVVKMSSELDVLRQEAETLKTKIRVSILGSMSAFHMSFVDFSRVQSQTATPRHREFTAICFPARISLDECMLVDK